MGCISVLSATACLFIIIVYLVIFNGNSAYKKFVIALAFSDFLYSFCNHYIAFILTFYDNPRKGDAFCNLIGSLQQYGFNASTFIVFCISLFLYLVLIDKIDHIIKYSNTYLVASMLIPAFISAWFILSDGIGVAGKWCFPSDFWQVTIIIQGFYVVPMISTCILFFKTFLINRRKGNDNFKVWLPLLQLSFIPIDVLFKIEYFSPELIPNDIKKKLWILFGAVACLNGLLNGIAYGCNKEIREEFIRKIRGGSEDIELRQRLV